MTGLFTIGDETTARVVGDAECRPWRSIRSRAHAAA